MAQARIRINDTNDRVHRGHPWVFGTQVVTEEGAYSPGDIVLVTDARNRPLGQGYINPASMIRVRMLTPHAEERVNRAFMQSRIERAWRRRERLGYAGSCRVVFGEADLLPGLVVDLFRDARDGRRVLALQFLTLGMERWREVVIEALRDVIAPDGIYLRNDVPVREKEGLTMEKGFVGKAFDTDLVIEEGMGSEAVRMHVDVAGGQKTGHFLDQVLNHLAAQRFLAGMKVLDCFTHTGGFALHAAKGGAKEVLGLDISAEAVALAARNAVLNGFSNCAFQEANVFDYLTDAGRSGKQWDAIVLDPPAFAKSKGALENAIRGYKEINLRALKGIVSGGYLITCSCSQHMTTELFRKMVADAAHDAGRRLREVHDGGQPPDHAPLWGVPETRYLKCLVLEVL